MQYKTGTAEHKVSCNVLVLDIIYSNSQKNPVTFPFRPVQTEAKWPFQTQKNGDGMGQGLKQASDRTCSQLFQL